MKKYIWFLVFGFCLSSCDSFLDRAPLDTLSDETYWQTREHLELAANACIKSLRDVYRTVHIEHMGDNVLYHEPVNYGYSKISTGNFGSDESYINDEWVRGYDGIRTCNHFLENYKRAVDVAPEIAERYAGEVRFMRAYLYTFLMKHFGTVQLITETLSPGDPEVYGKRADREALVDWVLNEFEEAAAVLPLEVESKQFGRPTRGMAYAFKSRFALYNGRWAEAEKAAKEVMDLGIYELYRVGDPAENYHQLFLYGGRASRNPQNKEVIAARVYGKKANWAHNLGREIQVPDQASRFSPTKSLIDSYLCADGKPIEISSLYREDSYTDIFLNRDPRMVQTILQPGDRWAGKDDGDADFEPDDYFHIPKFKYDKKGCVTKTGFYFTKYVNIDVVPVYQGDENDIPLMRYAEVLLNWAEARYEQGILTQDDLDQSINKLRERVGMHPMILSELESWGVDLGEEIHRERRVELVLEGERYFDLLRWKKGDLLAADVKGIKKSFVLDQSAVKDLPTDNQGYLIVQSGRRFVDPKNYLWPIPFIQWERNPNLGQNPGW